MKGTVLFAANRGYALKSSREDIIRRFLDQGWRVVLATADDEEARYLASLGAVLEPVAFDRGGLSFRADLVAWRRLQAVLRKWRPRLVHLFHAKPVIYGGLAARRVLGDGVATVSTITGLGHAFIAGGVASRLAGVGYRASLRHVGATIFQNRDDYALFLEHKWLSEHQARLIPGSGVDLSRFTFVNRAGRVQAPVIVMLARLLRQKGILEFIEVARRLRRRWPEARFLLAGEADPAHPDAVTVDWLREQIAVEYLGRLADVRPLFEQADLLLFPSFYREGVPRVVLEAAATGLPAVAFDVPGVREAVRDGETGYLVKDRDVDTLAERVTTLLEDAALRLTMGREARHMAEQAFDIRAIQAQYFDLYRELGMQI